MGQGEGTEPGLATGILDPVCYEEIDCIIPFSERLSFLRGNTDRTRLSQWICKSALGSRWSWSTSETQHYIDRRH